nr:hypothetical protein GCM10020185_36340 [Pseudomonas brassicacearum subsp. brassicacearum]
MFVRISSLALAALLVSGCANNSPVLGNKNISYGDTKAVETVTNEFGSTDLQMIAESMTRSLAQSGILQGRPVVQVYDVKNKTSEYIDTREITTSIKTQLMKTGAARFASDNTAMDSQVDQLKLQNQSGLYKKKHRGKDRQHDRCQVPSRRLHQLDRQAQQRLQGRLLQIQPAIDRRRKRSGRVDGRKKEIRKTTER